MDLTEETFRALARSSPWRWRSVHLVRGSGGADEGPVEAWIRRPGRMRVVVEQETHIVRQVPTQVARYVAGGSAKGESVALPAADGILPVLDDDGLVAIRPDRDAVDLEDPMWQSYDWVAMLDPVELGDGDPMRDPGTGDDVELPSCSPEPYPMLDWPTRPSPPGTALSDLREGEHHGRRTWWATAVPTQAYDPTCSCCPLLHCDVADRLELGEDDAPFVPEVDYPEAHEVALDVETGICVSVRAIGGSPRTSEHDVRIIAVDEDYGDDFFATSRRKPLEGALRRLRRSGR